MKRTVLFVGIWMLLLAIPAGRAHAITYYGGNGLFRVMSANNVYRGDLWASSNLTYAQTSGDYTYRDGTWMVNFLYGIRHALELGINQTLYQDRALTGASPAAGPLRISLKTVLPTSVPSSFNIGLQGMASIPVGSASNVEFESYSSPKIAVGGMLITSFDSNPLDLRRSRRIHLNLGFLYHNDKAGYPGTNVNSTQFVLGLALQFPITNSTMFFTEISGERYIKANPELFTSKATKSDAQDYYHFTPGIRQQLRRFTLQTGLDIRPNSVKNMTDLDNQPAYPRWRFFASIQLRLMEGVPPTYRRAKSMRISGRSYYQYGRKGTTDLRGVGPGVIQNLEERQQLLDQVEHDLQEIREQRIKAQRELEDLKKALDKQSQ